MIIQGLGSTTSLYSTLTKSNVQRQELPSAAANSAATVTISEVAKALASSGSDGATQSTTAAQQRILKSAGSDPQSAEKIAYEMANTSSTIFYDIRDSLESGKMDDIKLSSTGRRIDDAFKEKFTKEAAEIDAKRLEIYNTEKAKGTNPVEIIAKMIGFTNSQSRDYLEGSAWLG